MGDLAAEKNALRRRCRELMEGLPAEYCRAAGEKIARRVLETPEYARAETVFVFVGVMGEPDTGPLIERAIRDGKRVCVPRCREEPRMDAVAIADLAALALGAYGIPEPKDGETVDPRAIGLALIPCVAAARDGVRLGHGAGYYDAFLQQTSAIKWCLCFDRLLFDSLPAAPWDQPMDAVITETGVYPGQNRKDAGL